MAKHITWKSKSNLTLQTCFSNLPFFYIVCTKEKQTWILELMQLIVVSWRKVATVNSIRSQFETAVDLGFILSFQAVIASFLHFGISHTFGSFGLKVALDICLQWLDKRGSQITCIVWIVWVEKEEENMDVVSVIATLCIQFRILFIYLQKSSWIPNCLYQYSTGETELNRDRDILKL